MPAKRKSASPKDSTAHLVAELHAQFRFLRAVTRNSRTTAPSEKPYDTTRHLAIMNRALPTSTFEVQRSNFASLPDQLICSTQIPVTSHKFYLN